MTTGNRQECVSMLLVGVFVVPVFVVLGATAMGGAPAAAADGSGWECVTDGLYANLKTATLAGDGVKESPFARKTQGVLVDPTDGRIILHVHKNGLYSSDDHGGTWSQAAACPVSGRGESGFTFNAAHPFAGRFAVITIDGQSGNTPDGGKTWVGWSQHRRGFDTADLDWSSPTPQTIFALNHEPYYRCLSTDGGKTWTDLETKDLPNGRDWSAVGTSLPNATWGPYFGKTEADLMVVTDSGFFITADGGRTWNKAADF